MLFLSKKSPIPDFHIQFILNTFRKPWFFHRFSMGFLLQFKPRGLEMHLQRVPPAERHPGAEQARPNGRSHALWLLLDTHGGHWGTMMPWHIPGKQTKNYGKSPFLMGKSTINGHFQ
jgi:hypothetical protein